MKDTSPETNRKLRRQWLEEEASRQLERVIQTLDAAHTLPFECAWLDEELGGSYLKLLKEMESLLLQIWSRMQSSQPETPSAIAKIEHEVLIWYGRQKRSFQNIFRNYYRLHEELSVWGNSPEIQALGFSGIWGNYLLFVMIYEPHFLAKSISSKTTVAGGASAFSSDLEQFASRYLQKMQMLHNASPHALCSDFFTWISPFTQESVFLPVLSSKSFPGTQINTFGAFRKQLSQSAKWETLSGEYLKLLRKITKKRN